MHTTRHVSYYISSFFQWRYPGDVDFISDLARALCTANFVCVCVGNRCAETGFSWRIQFEKREFLVNSKRRQLGILMPTRVKKKKKKWRQQITAFFFSFSFFPTRRHRAFSHPCTLISNRIVRPQIVSVERAGYELRQSYYVYNEIERFARPRVYMCAAMPLRVRFAFERSFSKRATRS